jgi:hypothetical protein
MSKDKSTGKKLADMMYGNPEGAAFGIYPKAGKRSEDKQDREAAKNMPVDLARGLIAGAVGMPGDIESLIRMLPGLNEKTVLPTSEDVLKRIPLGSDSPTGRFASGLGTLIGGSAPVGPAVQGVKAGARGALSAARAGERMAERVVPQIMERGGAGADVLSGLAQGSRSNVIKPKGGNFLTGSVEGALKGLKRPMNPDEVAEVEAHLAKIEPHYNLNDPRDVRQLADMRAHIQALKQNEAINNWVDRNLGNYVKKEMATPEDPIRRLAEEGITHMPQNEIDFHTQWIPEDLALSRMKAGFPTEGMGQSNTAKGWEAITDSYIHSAPASEYTKPLTESEVRRGFGSVVGDNPWLSKLDPDTPVQYIKSADSIAQDLRLDHIVDVLREDLTSGRIRPEQLSKVSMEQAVRRTAEYDQELAAKMSAARAAQREGLPVYKDYPEGYKWVQLNRPGDFAAESEAMGHSVRGYEPPQGHPDWVEGSGDRGSLGYGVGGWDAIKSGKAKVYSLVDSKGDPHVTVEVESGKPWNERSGIFYDNPGLESSWQRFSQEASLEEKAKGLNRPSNYIERYPEWLKANEPETYAKYAKVFEEDPPKVRQIKGKGNERPVERYDPFTQDFVKSGKWSDVRDLENTGLFRLGGNEYMTEAEAAAKYQPMAQEALNFLETHPSMEQHRVADRAFNQFRGDVYSPEYKEIDSAAGRAVSQNVPYTYRELRALLSSPEDFTDRNGTIYEPISTAIEKLNQAKRELGIDLPPEEGMARGGPVHFSDNPDVMQLELQAGGLVKGIKAAKEAIKTSKKAVPIVQAPSVIIPKGISSVKEALRKSEGAYGARRIERAADEVKNLEKLYNEKALREAFLGDNAKAVVTMDPADFERYAQILQGRTKADIGPKMVELAEQGEIDKYTVPTDEYIQHLMRLQGGFDQAPYLNIYKDEVGIPSMPEVRGHEGRHRSRALSEAGESTGLVQISPRGDLREGLPRRSQEEYIEALREELERSGRLVLPEVDGSFRRPAIELPEPYAEGGAVHMQAGGLAKAVKALKAAKEPAQAPMKASEALGRIEGRPLVITQSDRTKVGGGFLGGPGFSSLQLTEPEYRAAEAVWGVKTPGVAKMILGGGKKAGGEVKAPAAQIDGNQFVLAAQKYGLDDDISTLNKMVSLVNQGATVEEAARIVSQTSAQKSGSGKIDANDEQQVQNPVHFTENPDAMRLELTKRN